MTIDHNDHIHALFCRRKSLRAFLRAFFEKKFGSALNFSYLCIVKEKRRNLRPA